MASRMAKIREDIREYVEWGDPREAMGMLRWLYENSKISAKDVDELYNYYTELYRIYIG